MASRIAGSWRIVEMDLWDREAIDLVGPAFIKFNADGTGDFRFIAVDGYLNCRDAEVGDRPRVDFTWEGNDDGDRALGRGWAQPEPDGTLRGHIFSTLAMTPAFGRSGKRVLTGRLDETTVKDLPLPLAGRRPVSSPGPKTS